MSDQNMRSGPQGGLRMSDQDSLLSRLVSSSAVHSAWFYCQRYSHFYSIFKDDLIHQICPNVKNFCSPRRCYKIIKDGTEPDTKCSLIKSCVINLKAVLLSSM